MNKWYTSSVDYTKLATTIQGVLMGVSAIVIFILAKFGINVLPIDYQALVAQVATIVVTFGSAISAMAVGYGLIRKIFVKTVGFKPE